MSSPTSTDVVFDVAPRLVLATIGDGSKKSRGGGARLRRRNPQLEASFRRPSKMGLEDARPRGSVNRIEGARQLAHDGGGSSLMSETVGFRARMRLRTRLPHAINDDWVFSF
ncbi:hypothetical protein TIFTF001_009503 [Ficus carica]|uniref:Uncharacterized protein n=1 Tax=Ficus carica TaxID=3494 RepID=A0AA88A6X3_FICCA|nr:hypothetical protein TIFTF001_009503 [Ficus carica]